MSALNKYVVIIISGLFLCPLGLDLFMTGFNSSAYIDPAPVWESSAKDFSGAVAWGDVDNDGDLDLAVGNYGYNYIYLNENGTIPATHSWQSKDARDTFSLDFADFDKDGDLDLAAGNRYGNDTIYLNENGQLLETPVWNSSGAEFTTSLKWGDIDSDGDLDLAACRFQSNISIYYNNGGVFDTNPSWMSRDTYFANSLVLGDINGDGRLDMVIGCGKLMGGDKNYMFLNKGTGFNPSPDWETQNPKRTTSLALGDYDRDGDYDLAVGTLNMGISVHNNINNNLTIKPGWTASDTSSSTYGIGWADLTGNGFLDLIIANNGKNMVYKNNGGTLESYASWYTSDSIGSSMVAPGDYDSDSDLDLAFSSDLPDGTPNKIYNNDVSVFSSSAIWSNSRTEKYTAAAWSDVDSDGDYDLAVGTGGKNKIFYNKGNQLNDAPAWQSSDSSDTRSLVWGDLDGDGDLDLVSGNYGSKNIVYRNSYGSIMTGVWWSSSTTDNTTSVALADIDTDGDLDLAVGNFGGPNFVYLNTGTGLSASSAWSSNDTSETTDIAWGDMDGDGSLELAVANKNSGVQIYYNYGNFLSEKPAWTGEYANDTRSVAWADINQDGAADLVTGAYADNLYVYYNKNGSFSKTPDWQSKGQPMNTAKIYLADLNSDAAVDLLEVNEGEPNRIFQNKNGALSEKPVWTSRTSEKSTAAAFGDVDSDGDFDFAALTSDGKLEVFENTLVVAPMLINNPAYVRIESPKGIITNSRYSLGLPYQDNIPIKYVLYDPEGASVRIEPQYSTNAGGTWLPATQSGAGGDPTTGLTATKTGKKYTFLWNSQEDNVINKNVMFRISVFSVLDKAGEIQRPYIASTTGVFPVDSPKLRPPLDLKVSEPTTTSLKLSWTHRPDETVGGYEIFMNKSYTGKSGPYESFKKVGRIQELTVTDLADDTTYYFKIRSVDAGLVSIFSNLAWGKTVPSNLPPRLLEKIPDVELDEDTKLFNYINLNEYYWDELLNKSNAGSDGITYEITGGLNINAWISPNEWLSIEPRHDYFGTENFTITASDSVYTTEQAFNITVNSVNDKPILNLTDGETIYCVQNEWVNLTVGAYDPADPHDILKFSDNSTLFDIEADTGIISFNPLPWDIGTFYANITVTDNGEPNLQSWANIIIVINSTEAPPKSTPPISTLVYPEDKFVVTTLKPTFMWDGRDADGDEIWYDLYLAPEKNLVHDLNTFARVVTLTKNITITIPNDLTNGYTYYWTVIPHDDNVRGTCESGIWEFSIDVSQDSPVVNLISPAHNEIVNKDRVRLSWGISYKGTEQVKYFVYFDTSPVPKTLISSAVNELQLDVSDLQDGEQYFWTVVPKAGNVIGSCTSGTRAFRVNLGFVSTYGVSLIVNNRIDVKVNETKLHDVTIINEGNNVDTFLITLTAGVLAGSVSLNSEWVTITSLGSGFIEMEPFQALTISLLFGIHDESLIGLRFVNVDVRSMGAQYEDLDIYDDVNITVNVLDTSGSGFIDDFKPGDDSNSTGKPGNGSGDEDKPSFGGVSMNFPWYSFFFAILIAIIIIIIYTMYLMRKTKKKFEVYKTAQEILESKNIDGAHPLVAGFLANDTKSGEKKTGTLDDVSLTASEAATLKEAFALGSGRYRQAEEELMIIDKPYSAAASMMDFDEQGAKPSTAAHTVSAGASRPAVPAKLSAGSYEPDYASPPPPRPYAAAAKRAAEAIALAEPASGVPLAAPMAIPVKKGAYRPEHIGITEEKPYDAAARLAALEQQYKEGKISKKLFDELKLKTGIVGTTKPVPISKSYRPDYMYLRAEKPYDSAAKLLKLEQKYREGKISKRLYEELKSNYV